MHIAVAHSHERAAHDREREQRGQGDRLGGVGEAGRVHLDVRQEEVGLARRVLSRHLGDGASPAHTQHTNYFFILFLKCFRTKLIKNRVKIHIKFIGQKINNNNNNNKMAGGYQFPEPMMATW
jgi:hypothetical protein